LRLLETTVKRLYAQNVRVRKLKGSIKVNTMAKEAVVEIAPLAAQAATEGVKN